MFKKIKSLLVAVVLTAVFIAGNGNTVVWAMDANATPKYILEDTEEPLAIVTLLFDKQTGSKVKKYSYVVNRPFGELPSAKREGYLFKGWYTEKSGGKKITKSTINSFKEGTRFYARWSKIKKMSTSFSKANCSKNVITLKWKEVDGAKKYQLCMSLSNSFKIKRTEEIKKNSVRIKGGRKGTKYFFKVRVQLKDSSGKKCYTGWSKVKSVTVK